MFIKRAILLALAALLLSVPKFVSAEEIDFPPSESAQKKLFVGEKLIYHIEYLGIPVGRAEAEVKEITEIQGRQAYHIVVQVRSSKFIDLVYKVRDEHHSYIDTEKLHTLQYEKILREGRYRADEVMTYDQVNHTARYYSRRNKSEKEMFIPQDVQDQLSCGYYFRTLDVKPRSSVFIPVNADEKNWDLEVKMLDAEPMKIEGVGTFQALEAEPIIQFQGIFVKRGKIRGWVSMDERRIPLKMKVKVPILGSVVAQLHEYIPGKS